MGLYVNPNEILLKQGMRSKIYVDKSMMLHELNELINTEHRFVCVSRPRRFGKTMMGAMIAAYYGKNANSRPLFEKLKISQCPDFEENLNQFNVIQIDVNACYSASDKDENIVPLFTAQVREEMQAQFPDCGINDSDSLERCIKRVYLKTGEQFVMIFDEYDVLVREKAKSSVFEPYLSFLNAMFKNTNLAPAFALVYLTGILPIVRDRIQSKLNLFEEYTMADANQLTPFAGFTEAEVCDLCQENAMDFSECERWYDGYRMNGMSLYSPKSVVSSMMFRKYGSYWIKTGSYDALKLYIFMNFEGIRDDVIAMLAGNKVDVEILSFLNTMTDFKSKDDVFTYLIHLGYLAYDQQAKQCYIPNNEIRSEWVIALRNEEDYVQALQIVNQSKELLDLTVEMNEKAVAEALNRAHEALSSNQRYNHEASLQCAIRLAYFYANTRYTVISELPAGKGYADVVFIPYLPNIPAIIVELKRSTSTGAAMAQIENKQYFNAMQKYQGDLLLVAVNYDEKTKEHACEIKRFIKA